MKEIKKAFLTTAQAAEILNVSVSTLKKFIYTQKLKALKTPGGHYRISKKYLLKEFYKQESK
ncbi:MAG: helix-turn-helix domain-containing protein [Candidatus Omnitrophica bacterium]|nr:helix-turn-helix domain-containing protein [Candidatus Omnitrophota bacterium]